MDVPAGVAQEEGHTRFFIHFPSAVRVLIFLARRIEPFFFLVDREVEFHSLGIFIFIFYFLREEHSVYRDRTHVPTCQKVTRLPLSYRGDRQLVTMRPTETCVAPVDASRDFIYFLRTSSVGGGGAVCCQTFFPFSFPCSADHERDVK